MRDLGQNQFERLKNKFLNKPAIAWTAIIFLALAVVLPVIKNLKEELYGESGNIFLDCRRATMPSVVPQSGHVYVMQPIERPDSFGGGGLQDIFAKPGSDITWNNTKIPEFAQRCELTNYFSRSLLNVRIQFHVTFFEAVTPPDAPNTRTQGPVTVDRHWQVLVPKLDPGSTETYVFYAWNPYIKERFILIQAPNDAAGTFQGQSLESTVPIVQSHLTAAPGLIQLDPVIN